MYWYKYYYNECVLCGHTDEWKERIYNEPKPEEYEKRHLYKQTACCQHFF